MGFDVVVVDDDACVRRIMERVLQREGLTVCSFDSPRAAVDPVLRDPPAVLITDLQMPGLDGIGLAAAIRSGLGRRSPRILLLTGSPRSVAARDKEMFDLIIGKPWDMMVLINAVVPWVRASLPHEAA